MGMRAAMLKACDPTLRPTRLQGTHTLPLALALTQQQQAFLLLQLRLEATVGTGTVVQPLLLPLLPPPPRHPTTPVQ
jgi:hypothetical protein